MIRDQLPALSGVAYLNTGTNGPLPRAAADAMREELRLSLEQPRIGRASFERLIAQREAARAAAGRVVGAPAQEIALTRSTSEGVGLVMSGLDWQPGDEILTTTEEHQGVRGPLDVVRRRHGADVREVPADDLPAAISERTRMVAVSHVLWTTGRTLDLPAIAERAHAVGAQLLADGAQSAGNIAVDAHASGADYYTLSGQKWLLGPQGSGALWVSPARTEQMWPVLSNYLGLEKGEVGRFKEGAPRFDPGSIDPVTVVGFTAAIEWVEGLDGGRAGWVARTAENAAAARERLAAAPGVHVAPAYGQPNGLLAFTLEGAGDTEALTARLAEAGVLVRFIPGTPWMRVSVGAFTSAGDIERLAAGLAA
ncbi:MAG TPA: aminotransferase class V-fold PLP-dependent enzyme [Gaiellales bacterium]|nr:aminotransferase class V-fold PLP-dependent enzyme [Gaiellales bacterium]